MSIEDEFEEALAGEGPDFEADPASAATGLDLDQVTQWVAQVDQVRRKRAEYQAAHQAAVQRLNGRLQERLSALDAQEEWLEEALTVYHKTVIANDPRALTIHTPAGTLKSTKGQPKYDYADEAALVAWALENAPEIVDVPPAPEPRVPKNNLKKLLKEQGAKISDGTLVLDDGTAVPGVKAEKARRNYNVITE